MAASSMGGASAINLSFYLNFNETKYGRLEASRGLRRAWMGQKPIRLSRLVQSRRAADSQTVGCVSLSETVKKIEDGSGEKKSINSKSHAIPNSSEHCSTYANVACMEDAGHSSHRPRCEDIVTQNQGLSVDQLMQDVESLLAQICDTTSIAEFELKFGGFRLYVTRDLAGKTDLPLPPSTPPTDANTSVQAPDSNGSVATPSLALSKTKPSGGIQRLLETATDEGLVILQSPRVGYFRRSRTIKGKRAPPSCKEKQSVKEGQVVCYIEQLGGELPIESDVSGEVIKILREDGEPVGYGDALITILPSFPGIKKLQ